MKIYSRDGKEIIHGTVVYNTTISVSKRNLEFTATIAVAQRIQPLDNIVGIRCPFTNHFFIEWVDVNNLWVDIQELLKHYKSVKIINLTEIQVRPVLL